MDYEAFYNTTARLKIPSSIRQLYDGIKIDSTYVLMGGGMPNPEVFPFKSATVQLSDGTEMEITEKEMASALQYGRTAGNLELLDFVSGLTRQLHDPPTLKSPDHPGALEMILTNGSQDGLYKSLGCILEAGDVLLSEEPAYSGFIAVVKPLACKVLTIKTDKDGIIPECLAEVLSQWPKQGEKAGSTPGKLKALYCVPNGSNPSGIRYTVDRKREIYRLAREYNFLIVEDDAYYFMEELPLRESFLSMDEDGRVIRLETFSKTIAPGLRIGCLFGPTPIVSKVMYDSQSSTQAVSGLSQMLVLKLMRKWGMQGYLEHCDFIREYYSKKREMCIDIASKHLQGLAEWVAPTGGMFLWIKFTAIPDSLTFVLETLRQRKVLIVAGACFYINMDGPSQYARVAYSVASADEMEKAFSIMAEELRKLKNADPTHRNA